MTGRFLSCLTLVLLVFAPEVAAQTPAEDCPYEVCALRVEPGGFFSTGKVVRGVDGERVGSFGFFGSGLLAIVEASENAADHARLFEAKSVTGSILELSGIVALAAGLIAGGSGEFTTAEGILVAGGIGLTIGGGFVKAGAQGDLARSIWWYNHDLVNGQLAPPGR